MTKTMELATDSPAPALSASRLLSLDPAVARCCEARARAYRKYIAKGEVPVVAGIDADEVYRKTMPPLSGSDNIRDFIACAAHGMLIGAIDGPVGARILYAAQLAQSMIPRRAKQHKKQSATPSISAT